MNMQRLREKIFILWPAVLLGSLLWASPSVASVEVGKPAPDFCLPSQDGEAVCLKDFKGKQNVLLLFYILDFTPG